MALGKPYVRRGSGGTSISIAASPTQLSRGDTVSGIVTLRGGRKPRTVQSVMVELHEHWQVSTGDSPRTHYEPRAAAALADGMEIMPVAACQWRFWFVVPGWGRYTSEKNQEGWSLYAYAVVPWGIDPRYRVFLDVLPEPVILALDGELEALGFTAISTRADVQGALLDRRAPRRWSTIIDAIAFHCEVFGSKLRVVAEVNWQERTPADLLRAMLKRDRTYHEFTFSPADATRVLKRFLAELGLQLD